ncbi:MAG: hypothetical protein C4534_03470 [Gaiellales bacterium]|nr:MAG: hypothetical protein C4534_03470 [Gaiellales bacterium]
MMLIGNLRDSLPGKAGKILTCTDDIEEAWKNQDLRQFPFNLLHGETKALASMVTSEYDDLDQEIDRRSSIYEQVLNLQHRIRMSIEFVVSSKVFESVERQFRRIDAVLPARNYALHDLLSELNSDRIGLTIRKRLDAANQKFDRQEYQAATQECCQAGEALFALFREVLTRCGCSEIPNSIGPSLSHIRTWLADSANKDGQGFCLAPRGRIEWLLLSLFESLHYLRNAVSHPLEVESGLPKWQSQRRELFSEKPDYARLGLCLALQIAIELQALLDHQEIST